MNKYVFLILFSVFLLGALFFYENQRFNDGKLHIVFCNVGQGDGIYIKTPQGEDIIVDSGPNDSILSCLSNHMPFWDREIELSILTHPDADHLSGFTSVIERYTIKHLVTIQISKDTAVYKRFMSQLNTYSVTPKYLFAGDKIEFSDGVSFDLFWPKKDYFEENASKAGKGTLGSNDFAIVGKLNYGKLNVLLTADAGANIEDLIASEIGDIDILKVPHHGSKTGMSDYFLSLTKPEFAIISVGLKNRYNHPRKESLDLLNKYNVRTLRTDINGEVEVVSDGKTYQTYSN